MASDNLTSLILGAVDRSEKLSNVLLEDVLARRRAKELKDYELEIYKGKMPLELQQKELQGQGELKRAKELSQFNESIKTPQVETIYDPKTRVPIFTGKPGEKFEAAKEPASKQIITQQQAEELRRSGIAVTNDKYQITGTGKESGEIQKRKLDLQKNLEVLKAAREEYKALKKGASGVASRVGGLITGDNPPERDWEDRRGALALSLWSAYTGERGRFSETDQELAMGLIPGVYEKGGESKLDKAIALAESGIKAIDSGQEPPSIYEGVGKSSIQTKEQQNIPGVKASDLKVGSDFGGGKIKAVRWK